jgi:hypothetical protein
MTEQEVHMNDLESIELTCHHSTLTLINVIFVTSDVGSMPFFLNGWLAIRYLQHILYRSAMHMHMQN